MNLITIKFNLVVGSNCPASVWYQSVAFVWNLMFHAKMESFHQIVKVIFQCINRHISCREKIMENIKMEIHFILSKLDNLFAPSSTNDSLAFHECQSA